MPWFKNVSPKPGKPPGLLATVTQQAINAPKASPTRREAKTYEDKRNRATRRGEWINPHKQTVTVSELVTDYRALTSKPGTARDRKQLTDNLGLLADMPVEMVRPAHVEQWARELRDSRSWAGSRPLSAGTVKVKAGPAVGFVTRVALHGGHSTGGGDARRDSLPLAAPPVRVPDARA